MVSYSFGYNRNEDRIEWWWANNKFVQIIYDRLWFSREGSINDLKLMAVEKAKEQNYI